jgi:hypothetical protein
MMMNQKKLFLIHKMQTVFYFLLSIFCIPQAYSEDSEQNENMVWENPFKKDKVDQAIEKGIQFILKKQEDDGSINDKGKKTAMTALSLMSMAAVGHQPIHPNEFGRAMQNALNFILLDENQDEQGYFGNKDGGRMYGHGIVTLMLSEMLGMGINKETDKKIRDQCQDAIDLILRSQKVKKNPAQQGGWRYSPDARDADLSVSVWQLMALRSAKNSGLDVPSSAISNAVSYLERSYKSKLLSNGDPAEKKSGFAYQPAVQPSTQLLQQVFSRCRFAGNMNLLLFMVQQIGYSITNLKKAESFSFMVLITTHRVCTSVEEIMPIRRENWWKIFS